MATETDGIITSQSWSQVSKIVRLVAGTQPWEIGLILLDDERVGLRTTRLSARMADFRDKTAALYRARSVNSEDWASVLRDLRRTVALAMVASEEKASGPGEYKAINVISGLIRAAQARIDGDEKAWTQLTVQACLELAGWFGDIAYSEAPQPKPPTSIYYDERVREINARRAAIQAANRKRNERSEDIYRLLVTRLQPAVTAHQAALAAAEVAEHARVEALPWYRRWVYYVVEAFRNSDG